MKLNLKLGDYVWCTKTGVRGHIIKFYTPTPKKFSEKQVLIDTDDGKGLYHAPLSTWALYPSQYHYGMHVDQVIFDEFQPSEETYYPMTAFDMTDNMHGEFVQNFAKSHGLTITEAMSHPASQFHGEFCKRMNIEHIPASLINDKISNKNIDILTNLLKGENHD